MSFLTVERGNVFLHVGFMITERRPFTRFEVDNGDELVVTPASDLLMRVRIVFV